MTKAVNTIRLRLLILLVALGLVLPTVPAAGHDCGAAPGTAVESCDASDAPADSCCPSEDDQDENEQEDRDCCPSDCACVCCGCATASPVMHRAASAAASLTPPSASQLDGRYELSPQDSVGDLIRPPQS
ncbi:MAG: hypothetical protein ACYSW2_13295 [Planctomycetota bacterium]